MEIAKFDESIRKIAKGSSLEQCPEDFTKKLMVKIEKQTMGKQGSFLNFVSKKHWIGGLLFFLAVLVAAMFSLPQSSSTRFYVKLPDLNFDFVSGLIPRIPGNVSDALFILMLVSLSVFLLMFVDRFFAGQGYETRKKA